MAGRGFQVLPFTLSEVFVLLFFVLALALANETRKRGEAERQRAELQEAVEPLGADAVRALATVLDRPDEIPQDFTELVRRVAEQESWRPAVEQRLREAGRDSARLAEAPTGELIRELAEANRELEERTERLEELAGLAAEAESGMSPEERLLEETERLGRENQGLRSQLVNLMRRAGTGVDHPPCWADADGRIEYAFEATLHTSAVDIRAIWPDDRDVDARAIPGMRDVAGQRLSYPEFGRRALPILRWSQAQEPSCRHFVRIRDRVDGGKDAYKRGLETVERYFYKLLVD